MEIQFVDVNDELKDRVAIEWGEKAAQYMHLENGFSILAMQGDKLVGLISAYWKILPQPLFETCECYIDILEVHQNFRRKGIASKLIDISFKRAKEKGAYQVRAWSSLDKTEAIPMWKSLGFGLCSATTYPGGKEVKGYFVTKVLQ